MMADRIPKRSNKSLKQIAETPEDWRTPEEEAALQAWCREAEAFLDECERNPHPSWRELALATCAPFVLLMLAYGIAHAYLWLTR